MILDDALILLPNSKSDVLNIYIRKATTLIKNYLNCDDSVDIQTLYQDAILEFVVINYKKIGNEGLVQFSQGSKSGTYGNDLPDSVKNLLPVPFVTMLGCKKMLTEFNVGIYNKTEGHKEHGIWIEGKLDYIKNINVDIQEYTTELLLKDYGYNIQVTNRILIDALDTNVEIGTIIQYNTQKYEVRKIINWDNYMEVMVFEL